MTEDIASIARSLSEDDGHCPDCGLFSCVCYDDDEIGAPPEDDWDECGMMPDGGCMLAGTEWCDWDCPRNKP